MAELFVPKIIDQLSDAAFTKVREGVNLLMGVEEEVHNLSFKLTRIQTLLHDAERRRLKEEAVGVWLQELEDITYEMEDVLEEWNIKILVDREPELIETRMSILLEKVSSFIRSLCSCLKQVPVRGDIALKIKEINSKLDSTLTEANRFNFVVAHSAHVDSNEFKHPMTTSNVDESKVQSRDSDKEVLIKYMLCDESRANISKEVEKDGVKVISIVGVGGSGKTTLAQILYNDIEVQKHFELSKWVCVSDPFDVRRIAIALLESPEKSNITVSELQTLFHLVKNTFSSKRFLLVLDDVWTEKYSDWEPLIGLLKDGAPGSIILVTTRKNTVATVLGTDYMHPLGLMSDSDCWLILKTIALSKRSELCEKVEEIGRKIAEKCKGLPLAAKILGSLLQLKDTVQEWQEVLNSKIWQMEEASVDLFPHFYLSYNELSPQLKRCFSYCAIFPKDTILWAEEFIRLWMAQGYLGPPSLTSDDRRRIVKGRECLKNLAMRSFLEVVETEDWDESVIERCKMHDIVHDFAQFLTKSECRAFDEVDCQNIETNGGLLSKERVRHLSLRGKIKSINSSIVVDIEKVRSFFYATYHGEPPQDLYSYLKCVRSLRLSCCRLKELPQEIGNLIHLRFLDISRNPLKELPETICDLYYLESLDVSHCGELECLPQRIGDLVHLRYLLNVETNAVKQMPPGLNKLTSLWRLDRFIADGAPSNEMVKLKDMNQLEYLGIEVGGRVDFEDAQLGKKPNLQLLVLSFEGEGFHVENTSSIEMMEPSPNLKVLGLQNYPGAQLPKWIVAAESFTKSLTSLVIGLGEISSLPTLGKLASLYALGLEELGNLKHIGREFFGLPDNLQAQSHGHNDDNAKVTAFPSLKVLLIHALENWETWEDISEEDDEKMKNGTVSIMPRLEQLRIEECRKLKALPHRLLRNSSSLKSLQIRDCDQLEERYSTETGADWTKIAHVPEVTID